MWISGTGSKQFLRDSHIETRLHLRGLPTGLVRGLKPVFVRTSCGTYDDGMNATSRRRAGDFARLLRMFPRNCVVRTSTKTLMLGILLNLCLISSRVILYFWTRYMMMPMMRLIWRVTNLSRRSSRSFLRAQVSHPQSKRLTGSGV